MTFLVNPPPFRHSIPSDRDIMEVSKSVYLSSFAWVFMEIWGEYYQIPT
jgi:hypothetical protein